MRLEPSADNAKNVFKALPKSLCDITRTRCVMSDSARGFAVRCACVVDPTEATHRVAPMPASETMIGARVDKTDQTQEHARARSVGAGRTPLGAGKRTRSRSCILGTTGHRREQSRGPGGLYPLKRLAKKREKREVCNQPARSARQEMVKHGCQHPLAPLERSAGERLGRRARTSGSGRET
jgi:hypothetical protein